MVAILTEVMWSSSVILTNIDILSIALDKLIMDHVTLLTMPLKDTYEVLVMCESCYWNVCGYRGDANVMKCHTHIAYIM